MHILCVTSSYPLAPDSLSGAFVREWALAMREGGHTLEVLTWRSPGARAMPSDPGITVTQIPYARSPKREGLFHGAGTLENVSLGPTLLGHLPAALAAMSRAINRTISRRKPDLLIAHWLLPAGYLVKRAASHWTLPHGVITHSAGIHLLERIPHLRTRRLLARHAFSHTPLTAVSLQNQARLAHMLGSTDTKVSVLPMGFYPHHPALDAMKTDLLIMGRLVPIKRVAMALKAIAHIHPTPRTHVLGDGPLRAALSAQAGPRVTFHGVLKAAARAQVFDQCGAAIFASEKLPSGREEGLPVSFLEACDAGILPCIAHLPAAKKFLVNPSLQSLPEPPDAPTWASHIDTLLRHKDAPSMRIETSRLVSELAWPTLGPAWCAWAEQLARGDKAPQPPEHPP